MNSALSLWSLSGEDNSLLVFCAWHDQTGAYRHRANGLLDPVDQRFGDRGISGDAYVLTPSPGIERTYT